MALRIRTLALALALLALWARGQDPPGGSGQAPPQDPQDTGQDPPQEPPQDPSQGTGQEPPAATEQEPSPAVGQEPTPPEPDKEDIAARAAEEVPPEPLVALVWSELLKRDARISFSPRSAADASAALNRPEGTALHRAAAWITLGCAGSEGDLPRIARQARIAKGLERRAAILALGEMAAEVPDLLSSLTLDRDAPTAEAALLAFLRSRLPAGRERVEAAARNARDPLQSVAKGLLASQRDPSATPPRALRTLIDLRWEAARAFGLVDGASFAARRLEEFARSPAFVSEVVLRAAAVNPGIAAKDHLLSVLLEGSRAGRLVAAVDAFPRQLSQLVDCRLWSPRDPGEWAAILDEIEREHVEGLLPELLARAESVTGLHWRAVALQARAGRAELARFAQTDLAGLDPAERALACEVLGSTADPSARALLTPLAEDPDAGVRAAALVARVRLGERSAATLLDKILPDRTHADHAAVVEWLCREARDPVISTRLEGFLRQAVGADLATVAAALTVQSRSSGRATVRSILALDLPPTGARRLLFVRALTRRPTARDLEILEQLFPQPGEEALNLELAVGLASLSDPIVRPILRAALWNGTFDESVLAAFLLARASGVRALIEEILRPPPQAGSTDLRRVGFALGEWGGVEALDLLRREKGSAAGPEMQGALLGVLAARTQ